MAKPAGPEIVSVEPKYRGWCRVSVATIRLADGQTVTREIEDHGAAACVLPYDPVRRTALLIRQLRAPALHVAGEAAIIETPAGLIDPGEDAETTARREAMEEVGVRLTSLEQVSNAWTMPGISTERMPLFLGTYSQADRVGAGGGESSEQIEVLEMTLRELAAMADAGTFDDLKTFALVQSLRLRKPELFTPA
jgi:nudix-type nucleoside diphosphatase (YffH/AdpP family)